MRRARMDYDATTHGISASIHRTRMRQLRNSILGGLDRAFEANSYEIPNRGIRLF